MSDPVLVALIVALGTIVNSLLVTWNSNRTQRRVAEVKQDVAEVHKTVNSERTSLLEKYDDLLARFSTLTGATDARAATDATAATFEAGRKEGADAERKGV